MMYRQNHQARLNGNKFISIYRDEFCILIPNSNRGFEFTRLTSND